MIQKWNFEELDLKDSFLITPFYASDDRGGLIKDYNVDTFKDHGIDYESAPFSAISRAPSGYHWSQQTCTPSFPSDV